MAGYYQGLLKAQGDLAGLDQKRAALGLLGVQQRSAERELEEFESTAPLRIGMKDAELKAKQALIPQRAAAHAAEMEGQGIQNRTGMLKMIQAGKSLFPQVGDQPSLDQANTQFEQFTGQPSPYRGKQWTPEFRGRVTNDLMTIEQRVQQQQGKWQYDSARGGLVNMQTGQFKPATEGGQPIGARADAKTVADEAKRKDETSRTLNSYVAARDGLLAGLGETVTGPFMGRTPALGSEQQIAQGAVSAMAPVLKQLFRVAGEGVFTDRDQALLLEMVPDRTDRPEARASKMANIDRIVAAKLGMQVPAAGDPKTTDYGRRGGDKLQLNSDGSYTYRLR
jgi:hypothetical protein